MNTHKAFRKSDRRGKERKMRATLKGIEPGVPTVSSPVTTSVYSLEDKKETRGIILNPEKEVSDVKRQMKKKKRMQKKNSVQVRYTIYNQDADMMRHKKDYAKPRSFKH